MNIQTTKSHERMHSDLGWLNSWHSFSFAGHHDPDRMNFGPLRVVNDDTVAPKGGFGSHPHSDMEIISLVLEGQLEHKDSMGNGRVIQTGDIQYMSAGTGVVHSEFNPSEDTPVHFLQIWIEPTDKGMEPRYADQPIQGSDPNTWNLLLSHDGREGSISIRQDVTLRSATLTEGASLSHRTDPGRGLWMFVLEGAVRIDSVECSTGDSAAIEDRTELDIHHTGSAPAQVLLFDVSVRVPPSGG